MATPHNANRRLAILIDGDNAQYKLIERMLQAASQYGTLTIRRAYGDWTQPNLAPWLQPMVDNAIEPKLQMRYANSKNATDSALIIDAMDILHKGVVQGFCIVSSDSDFTRLCTRIREGGLFVMGIGRKQTPPSFIQACDVFIFVEDLIPSPPPPQPAPQPVPQPVAKPAVKPVAKPAVKPPASNGATAKPPASNGKSAHPAALSDKKLKALFQRAFDQCKNDEGWAFLGTLGSSLKSLDPSFDPKTYGHKKLLDLVRAKGSWIEIRGKRKNESALTHYIRMRK
jgi:hypothetical protein